MIKAHKTDIFAFGISFSGILYIVYVEPYFNAVIAMGKVNAEELNLQNVT